VLHRFDDRSEITKVIIEDDDPIRQEKKLQQSDSAVAARSATCRWFSIAPDTRRNFAESAETRNVMIG
jgi:hypothetical protein